MRFIISDFDPSGEEIVNFQFSLWDSTRGFASKIRILPPFNSLYEILAVTLVFISLYQFFQFSLWDSRSTREYPKIKILYLSILFMRFLKLVILRKLLILELSILFMRFRLRLKLEHYNNTRLSILFMRFKITALSLTEKF